MRSISMRIGNFLLCFLLAVVSEKNVGEDKSTALTDRKANVSKPSQKYTYDYLYLRNATKTDKEEKTEKEIFSLNLKTYNYANQTMNLYNYFYYQNTNATNEIPLLKTDNLKYFNQSTFGSKFTARYIFQYYYFDKYDSKISRPQSSTTTSTIPTPNEIIATSPFSSVIMSTITRSMSNTTQFPGHATEPSTLNYTSANTTPETPAHITRALNLTSPKQPPTTEIPITTSEPSKDVFQAPNTCYHIIKPFQNNCPKDFQHIPDIFIGDNVCYVLLEKQRYPPVCPYKNNLPYSTIETALKTFSFIQPVWLGAYRNATAQHGYHEWTEIGNYGVPIKDIPLDELTDYASKNCLVINKGVFRPVSCSDRYATVCVYSRQKLQSSSLVKYCETSFGGSCTLSHYNFEEATCLCKKENEVYPPKEKFCEKQAELVHPFQSELLLNSCVDQDVCWIGFHKESTNTGMYKWSSTDQDVSYTRWASCATCEHSEGAIKFSRPMGWVLRPDRSLNCSICEHPLVFEEPKLHLHYELNHNMLELTIRSFSSIVSYGGKPEVHCFTDGNDDDFKQKVEVKFGAPNDFDVVRALMNLSDHPSHYWCDAFSYPSNAIIRSNKIVGFNKLSGYGHEFALRVNLLMFNVVDPFLTNVHVHFTKRLEREIKRNSNFLQFLRPISGHYSASENKMKLLLHITTTETNSTLKSVYEDLSRILEPMANRLLEISELRSSEVCFFNTTLTADGTELKWPETKIGVTVIPSNILCLDEENDMRPVTRTCLGDFLMGATWSEPIGSCSGNEIYSEATEDLFKLVNSDKPATEIVEELANITENLKADALPIDIYLTSNILDNIARSHENVPISPVITNIMKFNGKTLKVAQSWLNATDRILAAVDEILSKKDFALIESKGVVIQISDLQKSDVTGLAIYKKNILQYDPVPLYSDTVFEDLIKDKQLDSVAYLTPETVTEIKQQFSSKQTIKLIITVFFNDALFNELEQTDQQTLTKIVSVSVPGFYSVLESPVELGFKLPKDYTNVKNCSHWDYGWNDVMVSVHGSWKTNTLSSKSGQNLMQVCHFYHMTHFGLLLQGDLIAKVVVPNDEIFKILTLVGSALSMIGIVPIFLTALIFKKWRDRPGNIILLNFCTVITAQIIIISLLNFTREEGVPCIILGACFHYSFLSEFLWMFIIAQLQYRRFVLVLQPQQDHIIKKSLLLGWGVPIIPVTITLSISPHNYGINPQGFCSPLGYYSIYGLVTPVIVILIWNGLYFVQIIYNVVKQNMITAAANRNRNIKLELSLAVFLFFTLGLNWTFSVIGVIWDWTVFAYIFFCTSTLRGLVLFMYFIVGNKETRLMWKKRSNYDLNPRLRKSGSTKSTNGLVWYSE